MDQAVAGALLCKFRDSGQTCITANRMLVHQSIHAEFVDRLRGAVERLVVGDGTDAHSTVGPLIDQPAFDKVSHHVGDAADHGARLLMGGRPHERGRTFYQPTILDGLSADCAIWHEETFGPVAAVRTFANECEAVELANDTPYGLAAYMYSRDIGRIFRVSERLETGILGINTGFISVEVAPFGGVKESGIGREGSKYGVEDWIETRYLSLGGIEP